jgi:hypothetical protein
MPATTAFLGTVVMTLPLVVPAATRLMAVLAMTRWMGRAVLIR